MLTAAQKLQRKAIQDKYNEAVMKYVSSRFTIRGHR